MIRLDSLGLRAGDFRLEGISLEVAEGEWAVLMGRTGSGKTSILEVVCGLRRARSGRILLGGEDVTRERPAARGIGYVPQDGALFPTMSVRRHLGFALQIRGWSEAEISRRVAEIARELGIAHLLDRRPRGLSGGERQRVALGRALSFGPRLLCLDEPLTALDDETREEMYEVLGAVRDSGRITALHVTHNREEARRLGTRVFRLEAGRIAEAERPKEVRGKP